MTAREASVVGYLASGGLAAVANFGSRFVFSRWLPYEAAVIGAYGVGMVTAFIGLAYHHHRRHHEQLHIGRTPQASSRVVVE